MKVATSSFLFLLLACVADGQAIQKTECTNSSVCSLPNPVASGNLIVAIGGLSDASDLQADTFFEIPAKGWYAIASPMWYATGVHGGSVTVRSSNVAPHFYLAEYPPATLDHVAPQVFNCCLPSATIGLTTTFPGELLIEWTIYPASLSVQDATVSPGVHSFTIPQGTSGAWGAALVSFRLLGPEFVKYKAPYSPIQVKACFSSTCQFDNPVGTNDLLVAAISSPGCSTVGSVLQPGCVTDSQADSWRLSVAFQDGSLFHVLNAKGSVTEVSYVSGSASPAIIIAEYPPAVAFEGSNSGSYLAQNIDGSQGQSDDVGWTLPVQTTKPCDLLVSIGINNVPPDPTSTWLPNPVPYFTVRAGLADRIGLEDGTAARPGVYIASMDFHQYTHWTEGLAAFDLNGCK
jgi:hypothetical protein